MAVRAAPPLSAACAEGEARRGCQGEVPAGSGKTRNPGGARVRDGSEDSLCSHCARNDPTPDRARPLPRRHPFIDAPWPLHRPHTFAGAARLRHGHRSTILSGGPTFGRAGKPSMAACEPLRTFAWVCSRRASSCGDRVRRCPVASPTVAVEGAPPPHAVRRPDGPLPPRSHACKRTSATCRKPTPRATREARTTLAPRPRCRGFDRPRTG